MALIKTQTKKLTRRDIAELDKACAVATSEISTAIDYLDGNTRPHVLQAIADRFAWELVETKDPSGATTGTYRTRSKSAAKAAIEGGLFEATSTYLFPRVNRERSSLFSHGEEYEYTPANATLASDLKEAREAAGRSLVLQRLDWLACGTGSAAVMVQVLGSKLDYQAIARDKIWIVFADEITYTDASGSDKVRPVNTSNIDEASAVVIALDGIDDNGRCKYIAIFGRSEELPNGRMVTYYADSWDKVPDVGSDDASDYMAGDEIANPLTYWQNKYSDPAIPEYPIAPWIGDSSGNTGEILPVDLGLYKQSKEYDVAASRVLTASLKSARGAWEFHRDQGASNVLPDSIDEGQFTTEAGQTVKAHSIAGTNSESALAVIKSGMSDTATAFGVPAYKLGLTADTAVQSGVALAIMNAPIMADRSRRIELNRANMARIFSIECGLAGMENGSPVGSGVIETWIPNDPPTYDESGSSVVIGSETDSGLDAEGNAIASADVQQQMLNGAQVASMVEIAQAVKAGMLAKEQGAEIIMLSVPGVSVETATRIAGQFDPVVSAQTVPAEPAAVAPVKSRLLGARGAAK